MSVSEFLIRGGQTTAHKYRMTVQVGRILVLIAMAVMVAWTAWTLWVTVSPYQMYQWWCWHLADILYSMGHDYHKPFSVRDYNWQSYMSTVGYVLDNTGVRVSKALVQATLWRGLEEGASFGAAVAVLAFVAFIWRGWKLEQTMVLRGSSIVAVKYLKKQIRKFNRKKNHWTPYRLAGVPWPAGGETTHTLIGGTIGTGKTTALEDLIRQIRRRGDRAIIYDKMGNFTRHFHDEGRDVILNPFDARSAPWSVFNEGHTSHDFDMMAAALIPMHQGQADPFWVEAARILFSRACETLGRTARPTNRLLIDQLLKVDLEHMAALLKDTSAQSIIDEKNPKTALSVRSILTSRINCMEHLPPGLLMSPFSIRDWVRNDHQEGFMFLTSRGDLHESLRGLLSCWLEIAINTLLSLERNPERKIWIILDEVPSLFNIPSLKPGMAEARQFGGCFVLGLQVWSAMKEIYGRDGAETLSGLARTRLVLSTPDKDTADWASRGLGNAEQTKHRESLTYGANSFRDGVSLSTHDEIRPLVLPTEVMNLPDLGGFLRMPQGFPVARVKIKHVRMKDRVPGFIPTPGLYDRGPGVVLPTPPTPGAGETSRKAAAHGPDKKSPHPTEPEPTMDQLPFDDPVQGPTHNPAPNPGYDRATGEIIPKPAANAANPAILPPTPLINEQPFDGLEPPPWSDDDIRDQQQRTGEPLDPPPPTSLPLSYTSPDAEDGLADIKNRDPHTSTDPSSQATKLLTSLVFDAGDDHEESPDL